MKGHIMQELEQLYEGGGGLLRRVYLAIYKLTNEGRFIYNIDNINCWISIWIMKCLLSVIHILERTHPKRPSPQDILPGPSHCAPGKSAQGWLKKIHNFVRSYLEQTTILREHFDIKWIRNTSYPTMRAKHAK